LKHGSDESGYGPALSQGRINSLVHEPDEKLTASVVNRPTPTPAKPEDALSPIEALSG
jgi:hypothetical protein